jgi:hypothetical protein
LVPLSLAGMLHYATSDENNPEKFYKLTESHMGDINSTPPINNEPIVYEECELIDTFFGKERHPTITGISVFAGVKSTSLLSSFYSILPPILGLLGKHAEKNKLSDNGLMGFLSSQRKYILKAIPTSLADLEILKENNSENGSHIISPALSDTQNKNKARWIVFVIIIGVALLLWYLLK